MGITASGIGSGLDVNSLVAQLVSAESRPLTAIKTQQKTVNARLSAYGQLKAAMAGFQSALKAISTNSLNAYAVTSSNSAAASVTATSTAAPGNYQVNITRLAQTHKLCSPGFASASTPLGTGSLSLSVAGSAPININSGDNSLQAICDGINASGAAVSAGIVNDGSASGMRLVITATQSGSTNSIRLNGTDALAALSFDPAAPVNFAYDAQNNSPVVMSQTQSAQDAAITVDGLQITSSTNTITGAIQGVSLNLAQTTAATPLQISISKDSAGIKAALTGIVKAYNELKTSIASLSAANEAGKTGGPLRGDSGPALVLAQLRSAMSNPVSGAGSLAVLSDLGISFQKDGSLSVAESKLQTVVDNNPADLAKLWLGADGIATRLGTMLTELLGDKGLVSTRTEGINASLRSLVQRETSLQARLDGIERRYRKQFTDLDAALNRMQGTSNYLSQQLSAIARNNG